MSHLINIPKPTTRENNKSIKLINSVEFHPVDEITPFCISRRDCQKSFCACDLLDLDLRKLNPKGCYTTLMVCDECYRKQIIKGYDAFKEKIKGRGLREDFFDLYVAVKVYIMLNKLKEEIEQNRCNCGKKDCNFAKLNKEEKSIIVEKFNLMYQVYGTPLINSV